ncbi:MAG TPA: hypothetical protein VKA94_00265, partial [Hyphomicrobiales bacterium]|nr:hypothetical protein [Hyphomicrobiales bacterium]
MKSRLNSKESGRNRPEGSMSLVQVRNWFNNLSRAQRDLVFLTIFILIAYIFVLSYDALDKMYEFSKAHKSWQLDEILALLI